MKFKNRVKRLADILEKLGVAGLAIWLFLWLCLWPVWLAVQFWLWRMSDAAVGYFCDNRLRLFGLGFISATTKLVSQKKPPLKGTFLLPTHVYTVNHRLRRNPANATRSLFSGNQCPDLVWIWEFTVWDCFHM